jgi:hypothetical protein
LECVQSVYRVCTGVYTSLLESVRARMGDYVAKKVWTVCTARSQAFLGVYRVCTEWEQCVQRSPAEQLFDGASVRKRSGCHLACRDIGGFVLAEALRDLVHFNELAVDAYLHLPTPAIPARRPAPVLPLANDSLRILALI